MIFIRHGDPGYRNIFIGITDNHLLEGATGRARELGERLKKECVKAIYTSQLQRAWKTAETIGEILDLKPARKGELNELDFGRWETMTFEEVEEKYPGEQEKRKRDPWGHNSYGGESCSDVRERAMPVIKGLLEKHEGETFAVVAHLVLIKVVYSALVGIPLEELRKKRMDFLDTLFFKKDGDKIVLEKSWCVEQNAA